jgi:hypothetical protein
MSKGKKDGKTLLPDAPATTPLELREVDDVLQLTQRRGRENFEASLQCLAKRFADSAYCRRSGKSPEQLIFESVHTIINFLNDVYPLSSTGRPIGVPEVALLFGAVLGSAAAPAYMQGEVTMVEVEGQLEIIWISMREWLMRAFLMMKKLQSSGLVDSSGTKLVTPSTN